MCPRALAYSCNCAVAHWAERFRAGELQESLGRYGLQTEGEVRDVRLPALGEENIRLSAEELLRAYRRLRISDAVRAGMCGAVSFGTAQRAALPQVSVAGKTGQRGNHGRRRTGGLVCGIRSQPAAGSDGGGDGGGRIGRIGCGSAGARSDGPVFRGSGLRLLLVMVVAVAAFGQQTYKVQLPDRRLVEMSAEEYVTAVVAGEAGVLQSGEARKATAVAAADLWIPDARAACGAGIRFLLHDTLSESIGGNSE